MSDLRKKRTRRRRVRRMKTICLVGLISMFVLVFVQNVRKTANMSAFDKVELKAAGCRWSSNKKLWYWRHSEDAHRWHRGRSTIGEIRTKYGSQYFGTGSRAASLEAG